MKQRKVKKCLAAILAASMMVTGIPWQGVLTKAEIKEKLEQESVLERAENKTVFDLGDGRKKVVFYGDNVRYENEEGNLTDYDASLVPIEKENSENNVSLEGYAYENKAGDSKQYFPDKISEETPILMEKNQKSISFYPTEESNTETEELNQEEENLESISVDETEANVQIEKEELEDAYGEVTEQPVKAVYEENVLEHTLEYVSCDKGIKETVIFKQIPEQESFTWEFHLEGLDIAKNETDEGFTFYDKDTGEIAGGIDAPEMNDATGDAYSDAVTCELKEKEGEPDTWLLTMTPDREYLTSESRVYPVYLDPTVSWTGSNKMYDVYVCNGSYANTNFYNSGIKVLASGNSSQGLFRTYMQFFDLGSESRGKYVESAKLDLYEGGDCKGGVNVEAYRVKQNWKPAEITWNKKPASDETQKYTTIKTEGKAGTKHVLDLTQYVREIATSKYVNCGIMLRTKSETKAGNFTQFYNSKYATAAKRPKLTVVYYAAPTKPETVTTTKRYYKPGEAIQVNWSGITSKALARVEYRIVTQNDATGAETGVVYDYGAARSLGKTAAGTAVTIPGSNTWTDHCLKIFLRGVDESGLSGGNKGYVCHIDGTPPVVGSVSISPSSYTTRQNPILAWSSVSDKHLKCVQYQVNGNGYTDIGGETATSGTVELSEDDFPNTGIYSVQVRAIDKAGNISAVKTVNYYVDQTGPSGMVSMEPEAGKWTETAPAVKFNNVADADAGMNPAKVQYSIVKEGEKAGSFKNVSDFKLTASTSPYAGSFQLLEEDRNLPDGKYTVYVRFQDNLGNTSTKQLAYYKDKDKPDGKISFSKPAESLSGTVQITSDMTDGNGSGIKSSSLRVKKENGTIVETIYDNFTTSSVTRAFDTTNLKNGKYNAELTIEDVAGHKSVITKAIQIKNALPSPTLSGSYDNVNHGKISWKVKQKEGNTVKYIEYKMEGQSEWTRVGSSAKEEGTFEVTLPKDPGVYTFYVRAVNEDDIPGKEGTVQCIFDNEKPVVEIQSVRGGLIRGSIKDTYLKNWKIEVKEKAQSVEKYHQIATGTGQINSGLIKKIVFNPREYQTGITYDFKLTAYDRAGNSSSTEISHTITKEDNGIKLIDPIYTVKRPYYQENAGENFLLPENTNYLEIEDTEEKIKDADWYIDGKKIEKDSQNSPNITVLDFYKMKEKYKDQKKHELVARIKGADGNVTYSVTKAQGAEQEEIVSDVSYSSFEKTLIFDNAVSDFCLEEEAFFPYGSQLVYQIRSEDSDWITIEPSKKYMVSELFPGLLYTSQLILKVNFISTARDCPTLRRLTFHGDSLLPETFELSEMDNYVPSYVSAVSKINYKTYLTWSREKERDQKDYTKEKEVEIPDDVTYEVYRATTKEMLENQTKAEVSGIKADYLTEININYGKEFYYRIRAVREKTENGTKKKEYSSFSPIFSVKVADGDEYVKCLGDKDYWFYEDFSTPNGNGKIEISRGNFYYGQTEAVIPNNNMPVEISRAYNNQASSTSSLGIGWNNSYDLELLNINESDQLTDQKALKDATGTIFLFDKNPDGSYASSMGKYITLKEEQKKETIKIPARNGNPAVETTVESMYTMLTKDNEEYRFNAGGQLVYEKEPNGSFILPEYDSKHGRLLKLTTNQNLVTKFTYADNAAAITEELVKKAVADVKQTDKKQVISMGTVAKKVTRSPGSQNGSEVTIEKAAENMALVRSVILPDNSIIKYQYNDKNLLTSVEHMENILGKKKVVYRYSYDENDNLNKIYDALGNEYRLEYTEDRVTNAYYPKVEEQEESLRFTYGSIQEGDMVYQTTVQRGLNGVYGVEDLYKSSRNGNVLYTKDSQGVETTYSYEDNMLKTTSMKSEYQEIEGDSIVTKNGVRSSSTSYDKKQNNNPVLEKDEDGNTTAYEYNDKRNELVDDQPTRIIENSDDVITSDCTYEYDEYGNETLESDSVTGDSTQTVYYGADSEFAGEVKEIITKHEVISEEGEENYQIDSQKFEYAFDNNTGIRTIKVIEQKEGKNITSIQKIDRTGNTLYSDDGLGTVVSHEYDYFGRAIKNSYIEGNITSSEEMEYDDNGNLLRKKEKDGTITAYKYDIRNRKISESIKKGNIERTYTTAYTCEWQKNPSGQSEILYCIVKESPGERETKSYVNEKGFEIKTVSNEIETVNTYNKHGEKTVSSVQHEKTGEVDSVVLNVYDNSGNQTAEIQNPIHAGKEWKIGKDSIVTSYTYDKNGNQISVTDGMGTTTNYEYDEFSRIKKVKLPDSFENGNVTQYFYDIYEDENLTSTKTIDANGNISKEYLNENDETVKISDIGDGKITPISTSYTYDLKGNKIQESYGNGNTKQYEYDGRNRLIAVVYCNKNGEATSKIKYMYSSSDAILSEEDIKISNGTEKRYCYYQYTYDDANQLLDVKEYRGDKQELVNEQQYEYDEAGRRIKIVYADSQQDVYSLKYEYDEKGWLNSIKVQKKNGEEFLLRSYVYSDFGKVVEIKDYRTFLKTTEQSYILKKYEYDTFGRVVKIRYYDSKDLNTEKEKYEYTYDKNSNIITEVIQKQYENKNIKPVNEMRTHTYDSMGRLIKTEYLDNIDGNKKVTSYKYDKVGNRISSEEDGQQTDYIYNSLNQLVNEKISDASKIAKSEKTFIYDVNGNLTNESESIGGTSSDYSYDEENRLIKVVQKSNETEVMVQENTYNASGQRIEKKENGSITYYMYQDGTVLFTENELGEKTSFNLLSLDGAIITSWRNDNEFYFYNKDIKGSSSTILNENGIAVVSYQYSDFGETTKYQNSEFFNEVCYTGAIYDENTGLYYLNARFYTPENARFITQDTYRGETTDASSWNLYAYCANNPITQLDPSGHAIETILDLASIAWSAYDLATKPTWLNAANLLWDTVAFCVPFLPGSYSVKGLKFAKAKRMLNNSKSARRAEHLLKTHTKINIKVASKVSDLKSGSELLTVGKYGNLKKIFRKLDSEYPIEVHHIIEKHMGLLEGISKNSYPSIPLTRGLHRKITNRYRKYIREITRYNVCETLTKAKVIEQYEKIYKDMPGLRDIAIEIIEKYGKDSINYTRKFR